MDERFFKLVEKQPSGCWLWKGASVQGTRGGRYAVLSRGGEQKLAHRWVYEQAHGPIPEGLVLDHLCRNTLCVNPDHLEPVTNQENTLRGVISEVQTTRFEARTHCKRGHEMTEENTRLQRTRPKGRFNPDGTPYEFVARRCRACESEQNRRQRERRQDR